MKTKTFILIIIFLVAVIISCGNNTVIENQKSIADHTEIGKDKLVVLWTSADREVALKMAFMYTLNSKRFGWWDDITFVVWGPSAKLLSEDVELQKNIKLMLDLGIKVKACKMCSDSYGVSSMLEDLGITVKLMSELTDYLKEDRKILTL